MLLSWERRHPLLWRALLASLLVHALVAFFLPVWNARQSPDQAIEALTFSRIIRLRIERLAKAHPLPAALPQTSRRAEKISFARVRSELAAKSRTVRRPKPVKGPRGIRAAAPRHEAVTSAPPAARPTSEAAAVAVQPMQATPQPQATGKHSNEQTGSANRGGTLPFGADQPPVLDPAIKQEIARRFAGHVTLVVSVGEDGRTKAVKFEPALDPRVERAIEMILANAGWDAAVCGGGISCDGVATITF